jgi:hypothetical protein
MATGRTNAWDSFSEAERGVAVSGEAGCDGLAQQVGMPHLPQSEPQHDLEGEE